MSKTKIEIDLPITRRFGLRSYVFLGRFFFTRYGAEDYRADYVIMNARAKGHIQ